MTDMRNTDRSIALVLVYFASITAASVSVFAAPTPVAGAAPGTIDHPHPGDPDALPMTAGTEPFKLKHGASPAVKDSCFDCHSVVEGTSVVYKEDVHYHNGISCADCHGGDPKEEDQNLAMSAKRGFKLRVTRQATADYCGRCHMNSIFMRGFNPLPRVDQLALYRASVHAKGLAAGARGAECVDCHSVHNIRAVSDLLSPAHPRHVTETCATCHATTADLFRKSPHGPVFTTREMPGCTVCHASHATQPVSRVMLTGKKAVCANCHDAGSAGAKAAAEIARLMASLEKTAGVSKEALARARLAAHSCDAAVIRQAAEFAIAGREAKRKMSKWLYGKPQRPTERALQP